MNYTEAILWYISWPIIVWLSYKIVALNLKHYKKMERLQELEAKEQNK